MEVFALAGVVWWLLACPFACLPAWLDWLDWTGLVAGLPGVVGHLHGHGRGREGARMREGRLAWIGEPWPTYRSRFDSAGLDSIVHSVGGDTKQRRAAQSARDP